MESNMKCECPFVDHSFINNDSTLKSLLQIEDHYTLTGSPYFTSKVTEKMRHKLATWLLEVCEEEGCTDDVYSLTIHLFDRFMTFCSPFQRACIDKTHLQLIGCVCLFIVGKLKNNAGCSATEGDENESMLSDRLCAERLVEYTDYSCTLEEIIEWELLILDCLRWDVACVVANDFIEIYLHRCLSPIDARIIRKHAFILTALTSTDYKFTSQPASILAGACILAAMSGLKMTSNQQNQMIQFIESSSQIDIECLKLLQEQVEDLFRQSTGDSNKTTPMIIEEEQHEVLNDQEMIYESSLDSILYDSTSSMTNNNNNNNNDLIFNIEIENNLNESDKENRFSSSRIEINNNTNRLPLQQSKFQRSQSNTSFCSSSGISSIGAGSATTSNSNLEFARIDSLINTTPLSASSSLSTSSSSSSSCCSHIILDQIDEPPTLKKQRSRKQQFNNKKQQKTTKKNQKFNKSTQNDNKCHFNSSRLQSPPLPSELPMPNFANFNFIIQN
jgi:hypothetical protein